MFDADEAIMESALSTSDSKCLSQVLAEELVSHFIQAVRFPKPVLTFKTLHPYESHLDIREKVHIPGATKLLVSFDSRCQIANDMMTQLSFYRDDQYQDMIATCAGRRSNRYDSFIVKGDQFWFKFTSGTNNENWGYKFKVDPVGLRINDHQALHGRNLRLANWMLDFILTSSPAAIKEAYFVDIFNALAWNVCTSKPQAKAKGIEFLVRLLLNLQSWQEKSPDQKILSRLDFTKLKPLAKQLEVVDMSFDV
jgi:hypothetical protein